MKASRVTLVKIWILATTVFLTSVLFECPAYTDELKNEDLTLKRDIVECVSKNVWDDGFLIRFDLNTLSADEDPQVTTNVYQVGLLGTLKSKFIGPLRIHRTIDVDVCHLALMDPSLEPSVQIQFDIYKDAYTGEITELGSVPVLKYSQLECSSRLVERLASLCLTDLSQNVPPAPGLSH